MAENWRNGLIIGGSIALGLGLVPILIGFGTIGIVGGSIAAGIQAMIGNVAAGSAFATATSLGMQGAFAGTAIAGGAATGAGIGVGVATANRQRSNNEKTED